MDNNFCYQYVKFHTFFLLYSLSNVNLDRYPVESRPAGGPNHAPPDGHVAAVPSFQDRATPFRNINNIYRFVSSQSEKRRWTPLRQSAHIL